MSEVKRSDGKITSLGETYWNAAWRLMEKCNERNTEIPTIEIPLFSALLLAEGGLGDQHPELATEVKNSVFVEIKELLDVFMAIEKNL